MRDAFMYGLIYLSIELSIYRSMYESTSATRILTLPPILLLVNAYVCALPLRVLSTGSLGTLEDWAVTLCEVQQTLTPVAEPASVIVFCADHGAKRADATLSPYPPAVTQAVFRSLAAGISGTAVLARSAGAFLTVVDVGVDGDLAQVTAASKDISVRHSKVERDREQERERARAMDGERERERERGSARDRDREREREREREQEREREREQEQDQEQEQEREGVFVRACVCVSEGFCVCVVCGRACVRACVSV